MARQHPTDRFDDVPGDVARVGAHRAPARRGRGWIGFVLAVVATVILVGAGVAWITAMNGSLNVPDSLFDSGSTHSSRSATSTPTPTVQPTVDPSMTVIVLNGTTTPGLAGDVVSVLKEAGWKAQPPLNASSTDVTKTTVYYADAKDKAAALGAARSLSTASSLAGKPVAIQKTDRFADTGADLAVLIGSDYASSASDAG